MDCFVWMSTSLMPPIHSYYLFTVLLFYFHTRFDRRFGSIWSKTIWKENPLIGCDDPWCTNDPKMSTIPWPLARDEMSMPLIMNGRVIPCFPNRQCHPKIGPRNCPRILDDGPGSELRNLELPSPIRQVYSIFPQCRMAPLAIMQSWH
jgi:hypothetical protein